MNSKVNEVTFINQKLRDSFESLKEGKFEDRELFNLLTRAKGDLLKDPLCGTRIPTRLIPKTYLRDYGIKALWKYDLPNAWRLIYTITGNEVKIVSVILEWMNHKYYEKRFNY